MYFSHESSRTSSIDTSVAGAGKTMLTYVRMLLKKLSANSRRYNLIKHLQQQIGDDSILLFYFCDYKNFRSQLPRTVIQTMLADLSCQDGRARAIIDVRTKRYRKSNFGCPLKFLVEVLDECISLFSTVRMVIDAVDECTNRPELLRSLLSLKSKVSLFLTSRDEHDIRGLLNSFNEIAVTNNDISSDIEAFVSYSIKDMLNDGSLKLKDPTLHSAIKVKLCTGADGMWVSCVHKGSLPC